MNRTMNEINRPAMSLKLSERLNCLRRAPGYALIEGLGWFRRILSGEKFEVCLLYSVIKAKTIPWYMLNHFAWHTKKPPFHLKDI